jgi:CRISPR/Cas system-associated exonuclease Cas4 (RecB family)
MGALRVCVSASAADRLSCAREVIRACAPGTRVLIVGASRGAADDLARAIAASSPATFGLQRLSLTQLAAKTAILTLASDGMTSSTWLGTEAVAARVAFDATKDGSLSYFSAVSRTPGFPRALARTLQELRLAGVRAPQLTPLPLAGSDLADLLERIDASFAAASTADRAELFRAAARTIKTTPDADVVVLLDLPFEHAAERELVSALVTSAKSTLATIPHGDVDGIAYLEGIGGVVETRESTDTGDLACLRKFLFKADALPVERALDGSLTLFSAPGEGRESVEIARCILREARSGRRFDEMAILVRSPHSYFGLLEHALTRAGVPAWFGRGTRRPHPAGRAFLALLACAGESLSAARFAEYLSLGQVPDEHSSRDRTWVAPLDEAVNRVPATGEERIEDEEASAAKAAASDTEQVRAGTLRAPWRWEKLLVEAAVIGRDSERWHRRLEGKAKELERQKREALLADDGGDAKLERITHVLEQLGHLGAFALPIIETLASWPTEALWGTWLDRFEELVPRVLRTPSHVLRVLADLRPMAEVGPIDLDEARRVLAERLLLLDSDPPAQRYGRVFVGTPQQARGRSFAVVFVPGLAERMFPQKPREDALMLDDLRREVDRSLPTQHQRLHAERQLLQIATGAASERLFVSYPRIELSESRARVPSFYALDVMRAATGRIPHHEELERQARDAGDATLAWPAPSHPEDAIDDQEHDLAVLRTLLDESDPAAVRGHAHYLLKLNECLRRSVVDRWARGERRWSPSDGLIRVSPYTKEALASRRLTARPYSLSSLQKFSACPYQFLLASIFKLQPLEVPEPLQRMDPLTRGSLFHEIQAQFFREMDRRGELPITVASIAGARSVLQDVITGAAMSWHDELAPAVERVWVDEIASIGRDLRAWLESVARDGAEWLPKYFEYGFGEVPGERDPHSTQEPVVLAGGFKLKGAIDLIEEHRQTKVLRLTDHKTGRKPDRIDKVIINGGSVLQPVLYAMTIEAVLDQPVYCGRLYYCTSAGSFYAHEIPLNAYTREAGLEVLQVVDRAIERGFLAPAPTEEACGRCDFRPVCGPGMFNRILRKPQNELADLEALRNRP